nr:MAG TPA: Inovirus Gp2 [Caudoviricetes sp.]
MRKSMEHLNDLKCSEYLGLGKVDLLEELINLTLYNNRRVTRTLLMELYSTKSLKQLQKLYLREYKKMKRRIRRNEKTIARNRKQRQYRSRIDNLGIRTSYYPWDFSIGHYFNSGVSVKLPNKRAPDWLMKLLNLNENDRRKLDYNYTSIKNIIRTLFITYTKVMVIRLDFSLGETDKYNLDKLNHCFNLLQKTFLNQIPSYFAYYCVREYTEKTGVHIHGYFFFDGNGSNQDCTVAKIIGKEWERLSGGHWFSSNFIKEKYPDGGDCLGKIAYWEIERIEKLLNNSKYLLKNVLDREWLEKIGCNGDKRKLFTSSRLNNPEYLFVQHEALLVEDTSRRYRVSYSWLENCKLCRHYSVLPHVEEYRQLNPLFRRGRPKRLLH